MAKKKVKKQDWEIIDDVSTMGYRDDSPYRNRESIDIYSPNGLIDMSETGMPILANGRYLPPYSGMHQFNPGVVREKRIMQAGGRAPLEILDIQSAKPNLLVAQSINSNTQRSYWDSIYQGRTDKEGVTNITQKELNNLGEQPKSNSKIAYKRYYNIIDNNGNIVSSGHEVPIYETELNKTNLGNINPIPFEPGSYFTRERKPQEADRGKMEYFDKKTGRSIGLYDNGGELPEAGNGYKVVRSSERKGKTHKVTGPDGTVKFFGDSKLGQHPKDPARKKAFYARHKKNLAGNPYFRAFARKTWEEGGELNDWEILDTAQDGTTILSYLNPKNWGVADYTTTGNFDSAFSTARKAGEKEFLYNGQRFNTRKDTDPIKYTGANPNQGEYDKILRTQYPEFYKILNRGQNVGNISFEGASLAQPDRGFIKKNPNLLSSGNSKIAVGQNPSLQTFIGNLIAETAHLKDKNLDQSIFNPYTWKSRSEHTGLDDPTMYNIPGNMEYNTHRLFEPGIAMLAYGNLSPNDIKRIQKHLGVTEDGYFGENTYKALVDKYKDKTTTGSEKYPLVNPYMIKDYLKVLSKDVPIKDYKRFTSNIDAYPDYTDNALKNINIADNNSFDTYILQQTLNNRGYKLPKSIKEDGSFDGVLGDETKKALLDYQAKNKPYTQKAPFPGQSVPTMDFAQGGMLPDLNVMAFGGNLILEKYQEGGNSLEGDLYSKILMNRNRNKDFVKRAYAVGQYPGSNMFTEFADFDTRQSHKMGWGEDESGQAYMFPTIMNSGNEVIPVPNMYADYISSQGYKNAAGIKYKNGGSTWEILPKAQKGTKTGYSWSTNTSQAPKQQVVNTENVNTTKTQAKEVKPSFINTLIDYNLHPKEGQSLGETLMTDAVAIAPFFKDFPGYKKLAYTMGSQNSDATRSPADILHGSGKYDGTFKYDDFYDNYPFNRNLLKNYIYGDTAGFEKNDLPPIRLDRFQKKYGDIPSYDLESSVNKKDSLNINDIFGTSELRHKYKLPINKQFLDDLFKKNNDTIPIPFEEVNPYGSGDDIAGHMGYLMRNPKNNDEINFRIQDIWKFDPDDYSKKWGFDGKEFETYVQAKAMEASGKPFILSRQNPVKFPNTEEVKKIKTKKQIQLENDLAGEDAFFNDVKKQKFGGRISKAGDGKNTGYSWSTQQTPSYQPTFQGNYASSQTTGNRALTSKEMQANKIAAEKRVQQQKEAEYEARQAEYAARQARIKESIAAQNQPLSAENIMTQSQSTGDKMSFAMNTPFGNPKNYPVLSGYMEGLDYINPFKFVGDMGSGLGAVPYNVQQGNYGQAAIGVAAPLLTGALAGIGTQGIKQFVNNLANPFAGINFRKGAKQIPGSGVASSVDDVGKGLTKNSNELSPPPHEIISDEHTINLERLTPKNKRKMRSFDDSDIGGGLTLRNNPSRVENVEDILGKNRSIKSVMNKETGESIDLKTWRDDDGELYYYMSANMPSSKIKAGKAYIEIEKHIPKGASLLENSSLSYDSFLNILKQTKNPKFEKFVKGSVPMNNSAKNTTFKTKPRETASLVEFANKNHADDAVNELNLLLDKYDLPKATVINEYGNYSIQLPNIGLKKLYSIIGIGGAGAAIQPKNEPYRNGGKIKPKSSNWEILPDNEWEII